MIDALLYGVAAALALFGWLLAKKAQSKKQKFWGRLLVIVGLWLLAVRLMGLLPGGESEAFRVEIAAERMQLFGFNISSTVVITWIAMALVLFIAVLLRIFVIPKMQDVPRGIQAVLEMAVDGVGDYASSIVGKKISRGVSPYLFSIGALLVSFAVVELMGFRTPASDITMTFALALCTFVAFNYYGIKERGLGGRIHALASPTPMVFPIRIVSDLAVPVSMACRLFGNMLGGMVVMDLLYSALGKAAVGIPSVIGLYFNAFHPLIQAFIFITLTLNFIAEAAGEEE